MALFNRVMKAHILEATPDRSSDWQGFWHYVAGFFSGVSITILLLMLVL